MKKFARTISGVAPVAVMTQPMPCPGTCVYCPTFSVTPQSYTPESPAVLRAISCGYDARTQVETRLKILENMGHPTDKIELIIMGGTFLATPFDYQYRFVKECYDGLNGTESATLGGARELNESAQHRCTGLCIETRPDRCSDDDIERMLEFGTTRVELGVQAVSDDIYRLVKRGHTVRDVVDATKRLKERGFKVYYHWMPGLPGSSPEKDMEMSRRLFEDDGFKPDGLKLYPTMVIEGTELDNWNKDGRYHPYENDTMLRLIAGIKSIVPKYVRIARVLRDIPSKFITAGCRDSIRGGVRELMRQTGAECRCIRCREYGHRARAGREIGEPHLTRLDYEASGGREIFLSFEDEHETLFGLLRLRVQPAPVPVPEGTSAGHTAIVRELHIFGPQVRLTERAPEAAQHKGLGRALLLEAERIAATEFLAPHMLVLSGVGAREYYRECGYHSAGHHMEKALPVSATERG